MALDTETKDVSIAMVGSHENLLRLINKFLASDAGLSFMELTEEVVTLQELVKKIASPKINFIMARLINEIAAEIKADWKNHTSVQYPTLVLCGA